MDADAERVAMVRHQLVARGLTNERVLAAMAKVPRHQFVPEDLQDRAYFDQALPIGEGQTISQPYVVAAMTSVVDPQSGQRVLEVGTGCTTSRRCSRSSPARSTRSSCCRA